MKIAVAGKGGVGKTFISGTLARLLAKDGYNVLAIDADPNINLASTLGVPKEIANKIVPLSDNNTLIENRMGVPPGGSYGSVFRLTPTVEDIVRRFGILGPDNVQLLVMGTVKGGDTGCMCPANALLRVLIQHILIKERDVVVMDMVAGLEHLGRGTAKRMDAMIVVVEPRMKSIDTIRRILKLADEIEVQEVISVGNKIKNDKEEQFVKERMGELGVPLATLIPYDPAVAEADMLGIAPLDHDEGSPAVNVIVALKDYLKQRYGF